MFKNKSLKTILFMAFIATFVASHADVRAQEPINVHALEDDGLVTDFEHFYDDITLAKLAKLYWKLGVPNINDDVAIDDFLLITECDIFRQYFFNEFEWKGVQAKAREYIKTNSETFPVRFKYVQPLRLKEYDFEKGVFEIMPDYKINGTRKFEVVSEDHNSAVCNQHRASELKDYPRILLIELTQPLHLTSIPMTQSRAKRYIEEKMIDLSSMPLARQSKKSIYNARDAYMVMKIKMFTYKGVERVENARYRAIIYAMLEGYEIYADRDHENLLYFENYMRKKDSQTAEARLKEQYEALKKKRGQVDDADDPVPVVDEEPAPVNALEGLKQ